LGSLALAVVLATDVVTPASAAPQTPLKPTPLFPLELRALVPLGSAPLAAPASDGRAVFVPLRPSTLIALSLETGAVTWRSELAIVHAPVAVDGRLFVLTTDTLEALASKDGTAVWRLPLPASAAAAPVVSDDHVFVLLRTGELVVARQADGRVAWRVPVGGTPHASPVVFGDVLLVALDDGRLLCLSRADGKTKWEQKLNGAVTGLAAARDNVYAGALDNFFYCLDVGTGRIKWRWRTGGDLIGDASVDEERAYFVSLDNMIRALDRKSGVQKWTKPLAGRPVVGPMRIGDTLLLSSLSSELRGVAPETGEAAGRYDMGSELGAAPVFVPGSWAANDQLIAVSTDGTVIVLGRRLSLGIEAMPALPGTPIDITSPPPQQEPSPPQAPQVPKS
jgi:outer membrane protein assembly factor BamB